MPESKEDWERVIFGSWKDLKYVTYNYETFKDFFKWVFESKQYGDFLGNMYALHEVGLISLR